MFGISMYVYVGHITSQEELEAIGSFFCGGGLAWNPSVPPLTKMSLFNHWQER